MNRYNANEVRKESLLRVAELEGIKIDFLLFLRVIQHFRKFLQVMLQGTIVDIEFFLGVLVCHH